MINMKALFRSERLKMRHSFGSYLPPLAALLQVAVSLFMSMGTAYYSVNAWNWWYTMLLPGMLAILCYLCIIKEKRQHYANMLTTQVWPGRKDSVLRFGTSMRESVDLRRNGSGRSDCRFVDSDRQRICRSAAFDGLFFMGDTAVSYIECAFWHVCNCFYLYGADGRQSDRTRRIQTLVDLSGVDSFPAHVPRAADYAERTACRSGKQVYACRCHLTRRDVVGHMVWRACGCHGEVVWQDDGWQSEGS